MRRASILLLFLFACKPSGGGNVPAGGTTSSGMPTGIPGGTTTGTGTPTGLVGTDVLQFEGKIPKNLIFISIDTFRKDHMGVHSTLGLTPFLDTIAAGSVVMNQHTQCSDWTYGSTTCTLAGRTNIERGHLPRLNGTLQNRPPVPEGTPFLATWLGENGFYSQIVCANDWLSASWGNTQGYTQESQPFGNALVVYDKSMELLQPVLDEGNIDRWFMHQHYMEPHASYEPEEQFIVGQDLLDPWPGGDLTFRPTHYAWRDQWPSLTPDEQDLLEAHLRVLYEAEIRTLDDRLRQNWEKMDDDGLLDDALVVFWNDHGEQFWEHENQTHAFNLYGEENDGFLFFWAKNIVPGTYDQPTAAIDLVPTLLDLYGFGMPSEVTGYPIGTAPPARPIFTEALARSGGVQAVVKDEWKLHYNWFDGSVRVYDRSVDPGELNNLYNPADAKTLELWDDLRPQIEAMAPLVVDGVPQPTWPAALP